MSKNIYYHSEQIHNLTSAEVILPILFNYYKPNSIIDIGTGIGTWLAVAKENGVRDVVGVDGEHVDKSLLKKYLRSEEFISHDLREPFNLFRSFDLAICLEVAEHLPETSADNLVQIICNHSDNILFSAAVPYQGGQNHVNEQPPEYWINKFWKFGYNVYDPIRHLIWDNQSVDRWYKQNILFFSKSSHSFSKPIYKHIIHPETFKDHATQKLLIMEELKRIRSGGASWKFYLKQLFISLIKK